MRGNKTRTNFVLDLYLRKVNFHLIFFLTKRFHDRSDKENEGIVKNLVVFFLIQNVEVLLAFLLLRLRTCTYIV